MAWTPLISRERQKSHGNRQSSRSAYPMFSQIHTAVVAKYFFGYAFGSTGVPTGNDRASAKFPSGTCHIQWFDPLLDQLKRHSASL